MLWAPGLVRGEWGYDRSKDETIIAFHYLRVNDTSFDGLLFNAAFKCPGYVRSCQPGEVVLQLIIVNKGESYQSPGWLVVRADGERLFSGIMKNIMVEDMRPQLNITMTTLGILVPRDTFLKMARARKVEMKLDDTPLELSMDHRTALYSLSTLATP